MFIDAHTKYTLSKKSRSLAHLMPQLKLLPQLNQFLSAEIDVSNVGLSRD